MNTSLPIVEVDFLNQYTLFPAGLDDAPADAPVALVKQLRRPRSYDVAVLRYVAYYRVVTSHQIVYRFFVFAAKGPRYGFQLIRHLVRRGLLAATPLDPERGAVSRQVLTVTKAGWHFLGVRPPTDARSAGLDALAEYRLQFAETMLLREAEGWFLVREANAFGTLRAWALQRFKGRLLNDTERMERDRLERMPPFRVRVRLLAHRRTGDVRLILPVRRGKSVLTTLESLPSFDLFPPLAFELVCSEPHLLEKASEYLKRWARDRKVAIQVHAVSHFRERPHPSAVAIPAVSVYRQHGVPDPRALI